MRWWSVLAAAIFLTAESGGAAEPAAGLSCERLFALVQAAVSYRDQGYSLAQVLAGLREVQAEGKLSAAELETLRRAITLAYLGQASAEEIALECVRARGDDKPSSM
jgi:hypothetical protein